MLWFEFNIESDVLVSPFLDEFWKLTIRIITKVKSKFNISQINNLIWAINKAFIKMENKILLTIFENLLRQTQTNFKQNSLIFNLRHQTSHETWKQIQNSKLIAAYIKDKFQPNFNLPFESMRREKENCIET
jgi:hypothetical protein